MSSGAQYNQLDYRGYTIYYPTVGWVGTIQIYKDSVSQTTSPSIEAAKAWIDSQLQPPTTIQPPLEPTPLIQEELSTAQKKQKEMGEGLIAVFLILTLVGTK